MIKADKYLIDLLKDIQDNGVWSKEPRTKWSDGEKAHYKSVYHKTYTYDLSKGEFPITTMRKTALKGCFEEMRWIYQLQSNIIEDAHPCIWSWWENFVVNSHFKGEVISRLEAINKEFISRQLRYTDDPKELTFEWIYPHDTIRDIGGTYGKIVKKYDLMNKLLHDLEYNPDSRRKMMSLWDNQSLIDDSKALPPCAYQTNWIVRGSKVNTTGKKSLKALKPIKYVDLTLFQRSRDTIMTYSINPTEYVMLLMMVCGHLTYKTGIEHKPGILNHHVEDEHVYDRNMWALEELSERKSTGLQPKIELVCEPKDFYEYCWEDFRITGLDGITPLSKKLEIAI